MCGGLQFFEENYKCWIIEAGENSRAILDAKASRCREE